MRAWWRIGVLLLAACGPRPGAEPLVLLEFRQNGLDTVALNEELAFFFSRELDPSSVTSDSLCILDAAGRPVRGERRVRRDALLFLPELPRRADLSDGAFVPDARYTVVLGGFPRLDGIRAEDGALLSATLRLEFETAAIGKHPLFLAPFVPPFPLRCRGKGSPLVLEDGRIVLEAREPLDPSQVPTARFELRRGPELEPVRARLVLWRNEREYAELEVVPEGGEGRLEPGTYYLDLQPDLRTLGGRELVPAWRHVLTVLVPNRRLRLDFPRGGAPEVPPDCDGTALPSADGASLFVRYPEVAGSGSAGEVLLAEAPPTRDLHAARLFLAEGTSLDLSARRGPVVLRSQTALELGGSLVRRAPLRDARPTPLAQELRELADRLSDRPPDDPERPPLGAWLARLLASEEDWTVLIAGGDLRVRTGGSIDVDGPLVLVAGGWIRVSGSVRAAGDLWRTNESTGGFAAHARVGLLPFRLEPPATNPLVVPFRAGHSSRLRPGLVAGARHFVVPLHDSTAVRVSADLEDATGANPRLSVRFELWPRPLEPWRVPASGIELASESEAAAPR